jgi:integrase
MPKVSLTAAAVERLRPPAEGQADYFDKGYPGLSLRVSAGGVKTFTILYRLKGTRQKRRLVVGQHPATTLSQARDAWRNARATAREGTDPRATITADKFEAVAAEWLERDQKTKKRFADVKRLIERRVVPKWHGITIDKITRRHCAELIDEIADRGAVTMARRTHSHLHRLFRWCLGRGIIQSNPMEALPKPGAEVKRERALTDKELRQIWKAAGATAWPFGPATKLLILTAARRDEISGLRWDEVDRTSIKLTGSRTKNGEPHVIPLSPAAQEIIKSLPRVGSSAFVFTTTERTPVSGWSKAKEKLDVDSGVTDWRIHDARRTAAVWMQKHKVELQVVESVLGHTAGSRAGVVGVYQVHRYEKEKRAALAAWAKHIEGIGR